MPAWTSFSSAGRVQAGELDRFCVPYGYKFDGTRRAIIWCHGSGGTYAVGPVEDWLIQRTGCVWVCCDLGGAETWMGDTVLSRITAAWAYAKTNLGAKTDKMLLWGGSMGGGNALMYALTNPANVAAVGCAIPALDPEYVRANDIGSKKASIETIYGAGTVPSIRQVKNRGAEWSASVPAQIWYATDDLYTPSASTTGFATAAGITASSLGAVGHNYLSLYAQNGPLDLLKEHA